MPVIATLKEILALCWQERTTALKFGLVPLGVNLILTAFVMDIAPTSFSAYAKNWGIGLISLLAFCPFCVTWYRMILFGKPDIATRTVITFRRREWRFFGWTLAVSVAAGLIGLIIAIVGVALVIGIVAFNPVLGAVVGAIATAIYIAIFFWALSRFSMSLAMAAADQPTSLKAAWDVSKPFGWSMVGIQVLIILPLVVIAIIPMGGALPAIIEAAAAKTEPPASAQLTLQLVGTITGAVFLWLTSTMYALVYRQASAHPKTFGLHTPSDERTRAAEMDQAMAYLAKLRAEGSKDTIADLRALIDRFGTGFPMPADVTVTDVMLGTIPGKSFTAPRARGDRVLLHFHGGGFMAGSSTSHGRHAADLSRACESKVIVIDYALAPERPFPAAIDDCVTAYRALLDQGIKSDHIAFCGDSAGGGLVISALLRARTLKLPRPVAAVCLSPWVNLACDGETYATKKAEDPIGTHEALAAAALSYLGGADAKDPLASPYLGDLTGLPPLLIQVGTREVLLDDARRLANAARAAGVAVTLEEWPGMIHNWHMLADILTDGRRANARIGEFLRSLSPS